MKRLTYAAVASVTFVAAAYALPAELVVVSDKEVRPDEAVGLFYLGQAAGGYLYNGSSAALGRVTPYRILDREAQTKDYYVVWAPEWVGVTPADFEHLGTAIRLSECEILVGLEPGFGPGALRAVEHKIELIKLEPVTPVEWRFDGEEPPEKKDPAIEAAINKITEREYAGYIKELQDFKTRCTDTSGSDAARDYIRNFFAAENLEPALFEFKCVGFKDARYPRPGGAIYVRTDHGTFKRSEDNGNTWDTVYAEGTNYVASSFWLDDKTGFVAGYNRKLAKTSDGGNSWVTVDFDPGIPGGSYCKPWGICFVTTDVGWLGGEVSVPNDAVEGFIIKTEDGGRTWIPEYVPGEFAATAIAFFDANHGWAAGGRLGSGRGILYTDDGGDTWRECEMRATLRIHDLAAVGPREAWATSRDSGEVLHTLNALTWQYVDPGVPGIYEEVEFPDPSHGYAAGTKIIKTDDGGVNWYEITNAPVLSYDLLAFADENRGVVGDFGADNLYWTGDGGGTFVKVIQDVDLGAENVIGERRGMEKAEEIIIIGGHFDSASNQEPSLAPGAEDNASGTACAMAAARAFRELRFKRTVRYVAFGAEESGVIGSREYAKRCAEKGEKIVAVLNADMVAYDEDGGARDDYSLACERYTWLFDYLVVISGLYDNDLIYDREEWYSDHGPFWSVGYAAVGAIEGGVGPGKVMEYPYYHTTEDTLDKLHP
ncbi:MAG: M20/M25/M40 family metallo-hydrolase, partial [candidate division Zixibacteria bacterium]|nr:M20/M25/M40 family metallo-hydrolase [candidate division Zixibacteria bacterium]